MRVTVTHIVRAAFGREHERQQAVWVRPLGPARDGPVLLVAVQLGEPVVGWDGLQLSLEADLAELGLNELGEALIGDRNVERVREICDARLGQERLRFGGVVADRCDRVRAAER